MRFLDEAHLKVEKSLDFTNKKTIGIVVKTAEELEETNVLGLFIPKLLFGITDYTPKEEDVELNYDKIVNHENNRIGANSIKSRNYFKVPGLYSTNSTMPAYGKYEKVFVDFIDSDIKTMYFTNETLVNPGKREGDIYRVGAISQNMSQKNTDVESSKDNFYYMEFDTKNKRIVIQNSVVNGEEFQYTILLDAKAGTLSMTDGKRILNMNSKEDRVTLQNEADSLMTLEGDSIKIKTAKLDIEADTSVNIKTKKYKLETTNFETTSKSAKIDHASLELSSKNTKANLNIFEMTNLTHKITVPIMDLQVTTLACKGLIAGTGLVMSPTPPSPSIPPTVPPGNSVSEFGHTTVKSGTQKVNTNMGAKPTVSAPSLQSILLQMCIEIDKALMKGEFPLPPTCSISVSPRLSSIVCASISG